MIKGKQNILSHYDAQGDWAYWILYGGKDAGSRGHAVGRSPDFDNLGKDQGKKSLEEMLNRLFPGTRYYLVVKKTPDQNKGYIEVAVEMDDSASSLPPTPQHQIAGIYGPDQVEVIAEKKAISLFETYKKEQEIEKLKEKVAALEKENRELSVSPLESRIAGVMDAYPQLLPAVIAGIMSKFGGGPAVAVSGFGKAQPKRKKAPVENVESEPVGREEETNDSEESGDQSRLENALQMWQEADEEDFISLIEIIARCAKEKPSEYSMYKPMILNIK